MLTSVWIFRCLSGLFSSLWMVGSVVMADDQIWTPEITTSTFPIITNVLQFEDTATVLFLSFDGLYLSEDAGKNWNLVDLKDNDGNSVKSIQIQEFDHIPKTAFVFSDASKHFYTRDAGKTWNSFELPVNNNVFTDAQINYANNDYILIRVKYFDNDKFVERSFYSTDGLKTPPVEIGIENIGDCTFTKLNPSFTQGDDSTIVCIQRELNFLGHVKNDKVIASTDFFKTIIESDHSMLSNSHILQIRVVESFIALIVTTDRYLSDSFVLYTSKDGITFFKAIFEDQSTGSMFSILDSTPHALYIARFGRDHSHRSMASEVYRSDSDGRYFKRIFGDVLSNMLGMSLVSKVENLDGVWIASHNEEYRGMRNPLSKSKITMDDGENWDYLKILDSDTCGNDDECSLHVAWLAQRSGDGAVKTGSTPGILLGIGNVGKYLENDVTKLNTFISRDGGISWKKVSDKPSVFGFGDVGNIIVTVPVSLNFYLDGSTDDLNDSFSYSLDQGDSWTEIELGGKFLPSFVINNKDNTEKTLMIYGTVFEQQDTRSIVYTLDFNSAFDKTCEDNDMEEWFARRVDPEADKGTCVYGHSEKFARRKSDAKCFINRNYDDLKPIEQPCECTTKDTECSSGFAADANGECQPVLTLLANYCDNDKSSVKLSRRRIIPGNLCTGGYQPPVDDYTLKCKEANDDKARNVIDSRLTSLKENILYYQYLDKNNTKTDYQDETLIILTASRKAYLSYDSDTFDLLAEDKSFIYIFTNPYWPDSFYLVTDKGEILSSTDRGKVITETISPYVSPGYSSYGMAFDKNNQNTYILFSNINCDASNKCQSYASITEDNGVTFQDLIQNVDSCIFAESIFNSTEYEFPDTQILCSQKVENESYHRLISSTDAFSSDPQVIFEKIVGFATSGKYMVVAAINDESKENSALTLTGYVTVDGNNFAEIHIPEDIYGMQTAFTILDVNSDELFMHLTMVDTPGEEYGSILKANYNGTLFTTSLRFVNRNGDAYVDFESSQSVEGLMLANVLSNILSDTDDSPKQLLTKISHNDGATWSDLIPPSKDSTGRSYNCKGCFLHLHSYTERLDPSRDTFSSASALGMMFGLGNVGLKLNSLDDPNNDVALFFTKDAGITWKEVVKGRYIWEFGDQGTVLVIVETGVEVDTLKYSLDLGDSWIDYQFSTDKKYFVEDIATVPSDNSLKFILVVKDADVSNDIFTIDFTNVYPRQCDLPLDTEDSIGDDYEFFTPQHPALKDRCLFGHETKYLRRKSTSNCFVGMAPLYLASKVVKNCECTREDYECDYNYELSKDGTCKLVAGLESKKGDEICKNKDVNEWWEPTGYRKLQRSTCDGGLLLDKWKSHACPGKTIEKVRISGWAMFWVIFIPFLAFAIALVVVYERGVRRNGGFTRLGEIRLDEGDNLQLVEENNLDKAVNLVVKFGVFSFQLMGKSFRFGSKLINKLKGHDSAYHNPGSMGAFFNDMVDDDNSLFGDFNDDEDAREIDSFLERSNGFENDGEDDFNNFVTHDGDDEEYHDYHNDNPVDADNAEFRLSDDENDD